LLDISLRLTLFAHDVGIGKLLVSSKSEVNDCCSAVQVDDIFTGICRVVVFGGQLIDVFDELGLGDEGSIVSAEDAVVRDEAGPSEISRLRAVSLSSLRTLRTSCSAGESFGGSAAQSAVEDRQNASKGMVKLGISLSSLSEL